VNSNRSKRHCMIVHAYYPLGETRVQREAMVLVDHDYDVHVICLRGPGESRRARIDGVTITRLPVARHRGRGFVSQLLEYLLFFTLATGALTTMHLRRRFDTIQAHNLPDFLVFAAAVPKLMGTPVILDLHDLMPEFLAARTESSLNSPMVRAVRLQERLACRFADHVITVTEGWRKTLIERGVPAGKVSVVMNVADARVFRPREVPVDATRNGFGILYHGTFTYRYGVDLILEAVALLKEDLPSVHATLLGDGDARDDLLLAVEELDLTDHVTISDGMVAADQLPAAISSASVGVVPNRSNVFTEGILPTKLLEYVAMGVPVIAGRTKTVTEYFTDDQVEFFSPGDAGDLARHIRILHADTQRCRDLASRAAAFNDTHRWETISAEYASLVEQLGARRPSGDG
jgi:glycosyltransferase involved in cell wall biosynthesis